MWGAHWGLAMHVGYGMAALGALLGLLIAWSSSPVVAIVLPLLFGLVTTIGGVSLFRMDLTKPANKLKLETISASIFWLCASAVASVLLASALSPWVESLHRRGEPVEVQSADPFRGIVMRARLRALGASDAEIRRVLNGPVLKADEAAGGFYKAAKEYNAAFEAAPPPPSTAQWRPSQGSPNDHALSFVAKSFVADYELLQRENALNAGAYEILLARVSDLRTDIFGDRNLHDATIAAALPGLASARLRLHIATEAARFRHGVRVEAIDVEGADKLLQTINAGRELPPKSQSSTLDPLFLRPLASKKLDPSYEPWRVQ